LQFVEDSFGYYRKFSENESIKFTWMHNVQAQNSEIMSTVSYTCKFPFKILSTCISTCWGNTARAHKILRELYDSVAVPFRAANGVESSSR